LRRTRKPRKRAPDQASSPRRPCVVDANWHDLRAAAGTEVEKQRGKKAASQFLGHKNEAATHVYLRDKRVTIVTPLARKRG